MTLPIRKRHPLSQMWPDMNASEKRELMESIEANGVMQLVTIYQDMILDGWHRYEAARVMQVNCPLEYYKENDPAGFVIESNARRRHISKLEITVAVWDCRKWREKNTPGLNVKDIITKDERDSQETPEVSKDPKEKEISEEANVSISTVQRAKRAIKERDQTDEKEPVKPKSDKKKKEQSVDVQSESKRLTIHERYAQALSKKDKEIADLTSKAEELEEKLQHRDIQDNPDLASREQILNNQRSEIRTLKSQINEWISKYNEQYENFKRASKQIKILEKQLKE